MGRSCTCSSIFEPDLSKREWLDYDLILPLWNELLTWIRDSGTPIWAASASRSSISGYWLWMKTLSSCWTLVCVKTVRWRRRRPCGGTRTSIVRCCRSRWIRSLTPVDFCVVAWRSIADSDLIFGWSYGRVVAHRQWRWTKIHSSCRWRF